MPGCTRAYPPYITTSSLPVRILVVESDSSLRTVLARALEGDGYLTEVVADGEVAWDMARRANPPFDLIVTNTWLGHMGGEELMAALRSRYPGLPMLHLSSTPDRVSTEPPGPSRTLFEPFSIERFLQTVRLTLAESGTRP